MFLKSLVARRIKNNKLHMKIMAVAVIAVTLITIPIQLLFFISVVLKNGEEAFSHIKYRAIQIENEAWRIGGVDKIQQEFFDGILLKGEEIKVSSAAKNTEYTFYIKQNEEAISSVDKYFAAFLIETLVKRHQKEINKLGNISIRNDEANGLYYMTYKHTFKHGDNNETIIVKRNVTPIVIKLIEKYQKEFFIYLLYFIIAINIFIYFGLGLVFRFFWKALDKSFVELKEKDYKARIDIKDSYGKEISNVQHQINDILEQMQNHIEVNIESMQDVSHEVNNKLTSIKQSIDVLRFYGTNNKLIVEQKLKSIDDNIEQITKVMSTFLDLAKLDRGIYMDATKSRDVKEMIENYLQYIKKVFPDFDFIGKYDVSSPIIHFNKEHFVLALNPIIENAVRYSLHSNEIVIHIREGKYSNYVYIDIINWGIQIEKEEIPQLFNRYYRGKNIENSMKGFGMGLTISKKVMHLYKGKIHVKSYEDGKNIFTLIIPLHQESRGDT
ncbi:HAMP domain-containing sensor histidine kinase [Bacillus cereus]|uniref:sensor histidine kinase n=1 Tax=Bacillus cereus group TaxID=86661 RepID=UPI0010C998E7|nr:MULTISPECIES: HAMP domain-containing sensor histidine kinase [Bacillus cereus group]MBG9531600.1 histidine kinase [Bacillus thuringiensis]MDW4536134.1 HAMP domain-containing sensor histidine kinase [Bacillus cereus]MDZ4630016.1 HAMP domain-containing sensor histidine kinase [Bacillus cereus]TKV47831.1 sensor histidine kinase [Bacillus sp. PIC28]